MKKKGLNLTTSEKVIAAMNNLEETQGWTENDIVKYLSAKYNKPEMAMRKYVKPALDRGVSYDMLLKIGKKYLLREGGAAKRRAKGVKGRSKVYAKKAAKKPKRGRKPLTGKRKVKGRTQKRRRTVKLTEVGDAPELKADSEPSISKISIDVNDLDLESDSDSDMDR